MRELRGLVAVGVWLLSALSGEGWGAERDHNAVGWIEYTHSELCDLCQSPHRTYKAEGAVGRRGIWDGPTGVTTELRHRSRNWPNQSGGGDQGGGNQSFRPKNTQCPFSRNPKKKLGLREEMADSRTGKCPNRGRRKLPGAACGWSCDCEPPRHHGRWQSRGTMPPPFQKIEI